MSEPVTIKPIYRIGQLVEYVRNFGNGFDVVTKVVGDVTWEPKAVKSTVRYHLRHAGWLPQEEIVRVVEDPKS